MKYDQHTSQSTTPMRDIAYRFFGVPPLSEEGLRRREEGARVGGHLEKRCSVTLDGVLEGMERTREARKQRGFSW